MSHSFEHPAAFKAAVALAAHEGRQSPSELAERFGVPEPTIREWRQELVAHAALAFTRRRVGDEPESNILDSKELAFIIAENSTQGFAIMNEHSYCIYANRAWLEMTGYSDEEIRSRPLHELVHHHYPDGRPYPLSECPIDRALPENFEVRAHEDLFFRKDGTRFSVLCAASPIFRNGRPVATAIEIRDITDSKLAAEREQQLITDALAAAEANAKFRTFFEQGSHFAGVIGLDGTVIEANRLSTEGCGFAWHDVIGKKFWDCGWWRPSADVAAQIRDGTRQAATGQIFEREMRYFLSDGSDRMVSLVLTPVRNDAGRVLFIASSGVDITHRKRFEERLRLLDELSEATREQIDPRAIMCETTRRLGEHLAVTRCAYADVEADNDCFTIRSDWTAPGAASTVGTYSLDLFGPRAAYKMRKGLTLVIRDVDRELAPAEGADMFNAIGVKAIVCCPLVKEGRLVAMMAVHHGTPRTWTDEEVRLVEQIVERSWAHIERVRSAEALREADRHKTEFLAMLAHELRNPLAPIRNGLQLMKRSTDDAATIEQTREMMERQLSHMVHLVDDLLDIARINRGQVALKKSRVTVREVVAAAVETHQPLAEARGQRLTVVLPQEPIPLEADPVRIAQVVGNLLNNAIKYTPAGGRIDVSTQREGDEAVIRVADTGMGIPAESMSRIFDMFSQVLRNQAQAQGGLGIGLSLVRELVALHGGTVTATSPGIDQGSTFTVRLPLPEPAEPIAIQPAPASAVPQPDSEGLRVLVVDDNTDAADTTASLLDLSGYVTRRAYAGQDALRIAAEFRPDAVLLDIGLPDISGYEVAQTLRGLPETGSALLVALTGWGAEEDRIRSRAAGFDHHLTKPVDWSTIQRLLKCRGESSRVVAE